MVTGPQKPQPRSLREWLGVFFSGMCVGAADIVPGISGGTVAFIIGIYENLLKSIATVNTASCLQLCTLRIKSFFKSVAWQFLLAFVLGVGCSFLTLAKGFNILLNHEIYRCYLYAAFMGLVVGSVIFCSKLLSRFDAKTVLCFLVGAVAAYFLSSADLARDVGEDLYSVPVKQELITERTAVCTNYDARSGMLLNVPKAQLPAMLAKKYIPGDGLVYNQETGTQLVVEKNTTQSLFDIKLIVCGMCAISAMLLPGVSGSYLLTILGVYGLILGALVDFIEGLQAGAFDIAAFRIVFSVAIGICLGAVSFAKVVSFFLERFRDRTIACLIGFMVGAIKAVWPFWSYAYELSPLHLSRGPLLKVVDPLLPAIVSFEFLVSALFFIVGVASVLVVERFAAKKAVC